jgi:hypothetical protein
LEPLKERIAIKALHPKPQEVDRELLARVEALGASLRPTPVVRLVHPRLNLFAKLEYNNVVGSLKADREAQRKHRLHSDQLPKPAKQKQSAARRKTGAQGKSAATHKALSRAGRGVQQVA